MAVRGLRAAVAGMASSMRMVGGQAAAQTGFATRELAAPRIASLAPLAWGGSKGVVGSLLGAADTTWGRRWLYYSGSHYHKTHMIGAKNPELPKEENLAEAAVMIFGTAATSNPHNRSIRKLLLAPLKGPLVVDWYPEYLVHNQNGYQSPHALRREEKLKRLKMQGKGPPKKGAGKRASKKK